MKEWIVGPTQQCRLDQVRKAIKGSKSEALGFSIHSLAVWENYSNKQFLKKTNLVSHDHL
jgi:hypothetical protein